MPYSKTCRAVGSALSYSQGAVVTLDTGTGAIRAMVGGVSYEESQFNRAAQALRQPGSTFKVFAYGAALDAGIAPSTAYSCSPLTWNGQRFAGCRSGSAAPRYVCRYGPLRKTLWLFASLKMQDLET